MVNRAARSPDFTAMVRILTLEQGGRNTPPANGIRWDLAYADDDAGEGLWMIWPDFIDSKGDSLPQGQLLPVDVEIRANFFIVNDELRRTIHRARLQVGTSFFCHEGPKRVAAGRVTQVTGLLGS